MKNNTKKKSIKTKVGVKIYIRILFKQIFIKNIIFNIILTIFLFLPEIINLFSHNYYTFILNTPNKYIEINFDYSLLRVAFLAIMTSMNINDSYSIFCKVKKWNKYFLIEAQNIYLNNLISLNNILRYKYFYIPSIWNTNLSKICAANDTLIIKNLRNGLDNYNFIVQLQTQFEKYINELIKILLNVPIDEKYDYTLLKKFYYKFINQKKFINTFKNSIYSKVNNEKELIMLLELTNLINEFEESFLENDFITSNSMGKLNLEVRYLKALINFNID